MGGNGNSDRLLLSLAPKTTMDGDYSHEIKRHLLPARKAMVKPRQYKKSRDNTLVTKVHIVKAMVFPVVMNGCERWAIKNGES